MRAKNQPFGSAEGISDVFDSFSLCSKMHTYIFSFGTESMNGFHHSIPCAWPWSAFSWSGPCYGCCCEQRNRFCACKPSTSGVSSALSIVLFVLVGLQVARVMWLRAKELEVVTRRWRAYHVNMGLRGSSGPALRRCRSAAAASP
jgi:hypothetical protein